MSLFDSVKEQTEKAVSFVEWLALLLRSRSWVTMLLLVDVVLALFLNPWSLTKLLDFIPNALLLEILPLPDWYTPIFLAAVATVFVAALIVAYRTVPRKAETATGLTEHKAIKGLRPFGFEDAEVFARL